MRSDTETNCAWFEERIETYVDRDLSSEEERAFMHHSEECPQCSNELHLAERVKSSLQSGAHLECPDDVVNRIIVEVSKSQATASLTKDDMPAAGLWSSWLRWSAFAIPALILALALLTWSPPQDIPVEVTVVEPQFTDQEIKEAERQVRVTMAYLGKVGLKGVAFASREVIEEGIIAPVEKTMVAMLDTKVMSFGKAKSERVTQ